MSRRKYRLLYQLEEFMEVPMFLLAIFWLYLFVVELISGLSPLQQTLIYVIWGIFILEFSLKLFLAPRKRSYIKKNWLTVVALLVPALRVFRLLNALRLLRSARMITSTRIIRALTSGNRLVTSTREAQGPPPTREMHVGLLIHFSNKAHLPALRDFARQLSHDSRPVLEEATGIPWAFHFPPPARREQDKPVETQVFPADLMQTWPTLNQPSITTGDQIRLAAFISTVGVITGALAGGLEKRALLQHLALFRETR